MLQFSLGLTEHLVNPFHDFTKIKFDFTDEILFNWRVIVPHLEPQVDVFDEDEPHLEVLDPLGIQVVVDDFCLTVMFPSCMF